MRFVVNGMLGGLAKWLRMLGQTVEYDSEAEDSGLLNTAVKEHMTLLTRDEELHRRALARNIPSLLLLGETEEERLVQVAMSFHISLDIDMAETRCPECGRNLREASKEEVSGIVPAASLRLYDRFWRCESSECGKVYWQGSHWRQIHQTLERARKMAGLKA